MSDTLELTVTDDDGTEPDEVVLTINGDPVASTLDEDSSVEVTPAMRMGIGPAQLEDGDHAQAWVRLEDDKTLDLLAWGLIDSDEESPNGIELVLMDSGEEVLSESGIQWQEAGDEPLASVDGPANVFVQLVNNTGDDLTADSVAQNWAAGNFEYEVS